MSQDPGFEKVQKKLAEIRSRSDLSLRDIKYLRPTYTDFDGSELPFKLRYYQIQGVFHLVMMRRFLLGDDTGIGKTVQVIAALCALWEKNPDTKAIILTTKSAASQWVGEFAKFTTGDITVINGQGDAKKRADARRTFLASKGPTVLVSGYRSFAQDFSQIQNWSGYILVTDEATIYKNPQSRIHQVCAHLARRADRVWALTATLIKNNLIEGYGIYKVLVPDMFGTLNNFMLYYCVVEMQKLPRSNRRVPIIRGYVQEKIQEFKQTIAPYYIGRPKHEVASELPALVTKIIDVPLTQEQEDKYAEALAGILVKGTTPTEVTKLSAITYCQEICDHLALIDCEGESGKLDALLDLLREGDFAEEKVVIFTRFKRMVDILEPILKTNKIPAVRVTGDEDDEERTAAMRSFQNPNSDTRVCFITMAGSDSINLQAGKAVIFYDTPVSGGDYLQVLGRLLRIGSKHDRCYAIHLISTRQKKKAEAKTVDHRIMEILRRKMTLIEAVLGKRLKGESDSDAVIPAENDISELFTGLRQDATDV